MRAFVLVMLAACATATSPPPLAPTAALDPKPEQRCDNVVKNVIEHSGTTDSFQALTNALIASCHDDQWGDDVLDCLDEARSTADLDRCDLYLSEDQQTRMQTRIRLTGL